MSTVLTPGHVSALLRHFADLRDGDHGGATGRPAKEEQFERTVELLDPYARQALAEIDAHLLLGTGELSTSGVQRAADGGLDALWALSWPEQRDAGIAPVAVRACYGIAYHHPHLRGSTAGVWPLNVYSDDQAAAELPTLRSIVAADVHNLVFERDYRIIPATVGG